MSDKISMALNFRFGKRATYTKEAGTNILNYVVEDIGFRASKKQQESLTRNLRRDLKPIVDYELTKMAQQVSRMAVGLSNPKNPPPGTLKIDGPTARAMRGKTGPMSISSVTGTWAIRNQHYMKKKFKKYRTGRWFKNTGKLQSELKNPSTFVNALGPFSVRFTPKKLKQPSVLNLAASRGRPANRIATGRIELTVFGKLSLNDLPGISRKASYNENLLDMFSEDVSKKLAGPAQVKYRPVIEPFLTYYMRRKIPNSVFRKLEQSVLS